MSADRGVWKRLNGNTFAYSFMAVAVAENNSMLYLARVSGEVKLSSDCMSEEIFALQEIFWPGNSPFTGEADLSWRVFARTGKIVSAETSSVLNISFHPNQPIVCPRS